MNIEKSLSDKLWEEKQIEFKHIQALSQKKSISEIFSKLLISRGVFEDNYDNYINPNLLNNLPNPFELKDMKKGIERCIEALKNNEKIGIIADYDVDGSTSASILYKFLTKLISSYLSTFFSLILRSFSSFKSCHKPTFFFDKYFIFSPHLRTSFV